MGSIFEKKKTPYIIYGSENAIMSDILKNFEYIKNFSIKEIQSNEKKFENFSSETDFVLLFFFLRKSDNGIFKKTLNSIKSKIT